MKSKFDKLSDIAEVIDSLHKTPKYSNEGQAMVRCTDVKYGKLDLKSTFKVNEEVFKEFSRRYTPSKGDIIITRVGSYGITAIVDELDFCLGQNTSVIIPKNINARYLYLALNSTYVKNQIEFSVVGSTQKTLSLKAINNLEIPRFEPNIEDEIAKIGGELDDKIELNAQTNQTLEQIAQTIFKSWFVDFDPVKAKIETLATGGSADDAELAAMSVISAKTVDELNSLKTSNPEAFNKLAQTAALFPEKLVESELGLIPESWGAKPLGDYLTIKRGGSPRPIKDFIVPEGYPWTKIADATANYNPYIFNTKEFIKEEGLKKTVYLEKGTLILSNSATPGLPRFLELDACIHDGWLHFPEKTHFTDSYLYQLFLHIRNHLVAQGNGSVFTNLKTDILRNQVVLVPPKELVDVYDKHAAKLLETVKAKSIENNQLAQLRDTLLPKLLSGEIDLTSEVVA
ncbi:restriction endonuclease subunit S [Vibrio cholerae]|nr:restriction endonuclease subunit S [Vibrio cholerae]EKF9844007.1 restriction endonuclease subunit S [Vibrio cholerae]